MADPTIRLSTCRQDGRCPECGEPTVDLEPAQVCGCSVCFSVGCVAKHSGDLLTEALRRISMLHEHLRTRHNCDIGEAGDDPDYGF